MKIKVKIKKKQEPEKIEIQTGFIKLDAFLKYANIAQTGGHGKILIQEGKILVNGEVCTQRGRKLKNGDVVTADGRDYSIVSKAGDKLSSEADV